MNRVVAAFVALVAVAGWGTIAAESATSGVSAADAQTINRLVSDYDRPGVPGAAVAVIEHGRLAFMRV